jgi:SAM-dependent methyltransferase
LYRGGAYSAPPRAVDTLLAPLRRLGDRSTVRALGPLRPSSSIYEIGAGEGRLVQALRARGHAASGSDPFASRSHPNVVRASVDDLDRPPGSADVVVLWHVLEHLPDPRAGIDAASRLLRSEGRLVVAVPNLASLQARLGGARWFHLDVPRHRLHFTPRGVRCLLERCGLIAESVSSFDVHQNLLGMTQTLFNLAGGGRIGFPALKRGRIPGLVTTAVGACVVVPVALALESAATATGRGGSLVVHAARAR